MSRELVAAALAGDRSAWAGIWDLHGPQLHSYAWRLLGSDHDAQDAVADTFVSAAEHLGELRDPDAIRPWLYAICRRHVQRRWTARDRVRPVDDMVAVVDAREPVVNVLGIDAAEASALLWEAAEGLGPAERELLSLVLTSDLDSGAVARVTGDEPSAVYVKVSRLKDGLGRAAGALLVARHHREDCADLDRLLHDWDGHYSALWRKRIARHVDGCDTCGESRKAAAGALFGVAAAAPLLVLPALRDRCVGAVGQPELVPVSFEAGWPETRAFEPAARISGLKRVSVALLLLLLVGGAAAGVALLLGNGDGSVAAQPQATTLPLATSPVVLPSTAVPAPPPSPTATTAPTRPPVVVPTAAPVPSATTSPPPLPARPTVRLTLSRTAIQTACGVDTTTVASAVVTGAGTATVISWDGTAPGSKAVPGSGEATIGPFSSVEDASGTDTVTVTATTEDALGRKASVTRTFTVTVAPC